MRTGPGRPRSRGFTLLEVMIALALLGIGLTVLIRSVASNMYSAQDAQMMGVATDLARGKMYDVEEKLMKDGFTDTDQSDKGDFADEGWPLIKWEAKVEQVELPSWDDLQQMAKGHAAKQMGSGSGTAFGSGSDFGSGFGSGLGSDALNGFQNSALGGMLSQFGGGFGGTSGSGDVAAGQGALVIQSQYTMVQQVLKVSIRKVTVDVKYTVAGRDEDIPVVTYFTDAAAMDKVLMGLGSQDVDDQQGSGSGSGSGRGSGSGSGSGSGAVPRPVTPPPGPQK
jgi:general secretion pathway protein I